MTTIETHAPSASSGSGIASVGAWISTTDHKRLGRLYLGVSALGLLGSLVVAALLAVERIDTSGTFLKIGSITQMFSAYRFGLTYIVALPAVVGVALAVVPLQLGARSLAFPRLAAAGFWTWLIGAVLSIVAIIGNGGPGGGNARFVDLFTLAAILAFAGLAGSSISLATSILTTRAPGMNMRRVPVFSWSVLVMAITVVIAMPILIGLLLYVYVAHKYPSLSDLSGNRALDTWVGFGFTHPTTLLFTIPVFGFLAESVATASRRRLPARGTVFATIAIIGVAVLGTAVQTPVVIRSGFRSLSGGDKVSDLLPYALVHVLPLLGAFLTFALVASALLTKPKITAPTVFGLLGGLLALLAILASAVQHIGDAALNGTVYEEGTWLLTTFSIVLFALGAVTYWGPKWWGRTIPSMPAMGIALVGFAGAVLAAAPLLIAGFADQPGGVFPTVEQGQPGVILFSYSGPAKLWNTLSAIGLVLVLVAVLAFIGLATRAALRGEVAGDDPWDGQTLEWATTSPAPADNFAALHVVTSPEPLLDLKPSNRSDA